MSSLDDLRDFVIEATKVVETGTEEAATVAVMTPLLAKLIAQDDWLPRDYALPHPDYYRQYLLHADPLERFSIVSFVWGPGQRTPVHDHRVWGLVGVLRGAELSIDYAKAPDGSLQAGAEERLEPGTIIGLSPPGRDIHTIRNAYDDRVSISIHVYGANIGAVRRAVYDPGQRKRKALCVRLFKRVCTESVGPVRQSSRAFAGLAHRLKRARRFRIHMMRSKKLRWHQTDSRLRRGQLLDGPIRCDRREPTPDGSDMRLCRP